MKHRKGYLFKRAGVWYVQWRVGGQKFVRSLGTTSETRAETERERIMDGIRTADEVRALQHVTARLRSAQGELARQAVPIADAWRLYLASPSRPDSGPATIQQYSAEWGRFARWLAATCPGVSTLAQLTERQATSYAASLEGVSASTFNQHVGLLRLMWRVLDVEPNPWRGIRRRHRSTEGRRELSVDELKAVFAAATGELHRLLTIGLYTGLRLGDCCLLRWQDVDQVAGLIRVVPAKTARSGKTVSIPIHPALAAAIGTPHDGYVMPGMARFYQRNRSGVALLVRRHFKACGIVTQVARSGSRVGCVVGFHSLRHTFVSLCRQAGAPLAIVEAIVGHSNPAMTRHYTHVGDDAARAAVGMLPEL